MQFEKVAVAQRGSEGIIFEMMLDNPVAREVTILSWEFQLWLLRQPAGGDVSYLGPLIPELYGGFDFELQFKPHEQKRFNFAWHYTPQHLQRVEEWREDGEPNFEVRSRISAASIWDAPPGREKKHVFSGEGVPSKGSYPMRFSITQSQWAAVLDQVGFRHIVLYEFPFPTSPPGFSRSEVYLKEAWEHHRAGRKDEALLACRKAFEPLAYNLLGDDRLNRADLLERVMTQSAPEKRTSILKFWESLQNFLNMGVHERGKAVELTKADSELALICTTALLGYLAKQK